MTTDTVLTFIAVGIGAMQIPLAIFLAIRSTNLSRLDVLQNDVAELKKSSTEQRQGLGTAYTFALDVERWAERMEARCRRIEAIHRHTLPNEVSPFETTKSDDLNLKRLQLFSEDPKRFVQAVLALAQIGNANDLELVRKVYIRREYGLAGAGKLDAKHDQVVKFHIREWADREKAIDHEILGNGVSGSLH